MAGLDILEKLNKMKRNLKYFVFFIVWILVFYMNFSFIEAGIYISNWSVISRSHFSFYGVIVGGLATIFYWVDDRLKF